MKNSAMVYKISKCADLLIKWTVLLMQLELLGRFTVNLHAYYYPNILVSKIHIQEQNKKNVL